MPDVPIVDSHVHLWDPTVFRMSWLDGTPIDKPFGLAEYRAATDGLPIDGMVYLQVEVEPAYGLLEARWAAKRADEEPRMKAIVAWAPLEFGEQAQAYLAELVSIDPRIKGVRRLIQGESLDFAAQARFVRGVQLLPELGLSFDICIKHPQLPSVLELVRQCPDVWFILDHIGKPDIAAGLREPWRTQLKELADFPNVVCKVSGMVTEADHNSWTADDLRPYVEHVIESFGEDRVVFGGDWPVATLASPYKRWVETLDQLTDGLSTEAKRRLWGENARLFYRI